MGVYIKGMEMPKKAEKCRFFGDAMFGRRPYCYVRPGGSCHFPEDCPLVPIPPHRRLIDADALRQDWLENGENEYVYDTNAFLDSLDHAPTIIPAEEGE